MTSARPGFAPKLLPTDWPGTRLVGRDFDLRSRGGAVWASVAYRRTCVRREHAGVTVRPTRTSAAFRAMPINEKLNRHFAGGRSLMHVVTDTTPPAEAGQDDRRTRLARCLERARGGELAALDEVVRELNPLLWNVARAQNLSADQAADVVQTTWLELLRRLHEIRSPQALAAWLVTTTRREAWRVRTWHRQHTPEGTEILESTPDPGPDVSERIESDERDHVLWRLPPQDVVALVRLDAFRHIGAGVGCGLENLCTLRRVLAMPGGDPPRLSAGGGDQPCGERLRRSNLV